jgi:hypothetical protein
VSAPDLGDLRALVDAAARYEAAYGSGDHDAWQEAETAFGDFLANDSGYLMREARLVGRFAPLLDVVEKDVRHIVTDDILVSTGDLQRLSFALRAGAGTSTEEPQPPQPSADR